MSEAEAPGTLLHVGCGYATEWRKAGFPADVARIVLVEPNPSCHEELQDMARGDDRLTLIGAAAAAGDGQAVFHVMSFDDLSGLAAAPRLAALMPGLTEERQISVRCLSAASLLTEAGVAGRDNRLVLEALGEESALLRALIASGDLARFASLRVNMARQPLQEGDFDPAGLVAALAAEGFSVQPEAPDADPDLPQLLFRRETRLLELLQAQRGLEASLRDARAEVAQLAGTVKEKDSGLVTARVAQDNLTARIRDLDARLKAADEKATGLATSGAAALAAAGAETETLRAAHAALQAEGTRLAGRVTEQEAALESAAAVAADLTARLAETVAAAEAEQARLEAAVQAETRRADQAGEAARTAGARIGALETALEESARKLAATEAEVQKFRSAHEGARAESARQSGIAAERETALAALRTAQADLAQRLAATEARAAADNQRQTALLAEKESALTVAKGAQYSLDRQLTVAQTDLGLALRMQAVAAADLKDLQARYAEVRAGKDSQDRLIAQLALRLEEASEHLQAQALAKPAQPQPALAQSVLAQPVLPEPALAEPAPLPPARRTKGKARKKKEGRPA